MGRASFGPNGYVNSGGFTEEIGFAGLISKFTYGLLVKLGSITNPESIFTPNFESPDPVEEVSGLKLYLTPNLGESELFCAGLASFVLPSTYFTTIVEWASCVIAAEYSKYWMYLIIIIRRIEILDLMFIKLENSILLN